MNFKDRRKLKRYELTVYGMLLTVSIIIGFIGDKITQETIKSITINLASELLAVGILFFIINRIFLLGDDSNDNINKILNEIDKIKDLLHKEFEQEQKRQEQEISVILQSGAKSLKLPVELRRAEFTRSEILGRIGMIPMKNSGQRFAIDYLNTPEFLRQINHILASDSNSILTIPCNEKEYDQFDLDRTNN